jgi:folylpolyglutamate synthase
LSRHNAAPAQHTSSSAASMTQQLAPAAAASLANNMDANNSNANTSNTSNIPNETNGAIVGVGSSSLSLTAQVDTAMAKLLGVSAKFKDLTGQDRQVSTREETIAMMHHYMDRLHMTHAVRHKLSVIHVAGTKGKGSTCAMTERILREAGFKTGLFTSPHLISPCERIRINGAPIPQDVFVKHFDRVWHGLESTAHESGAFPPMAWFFRFLTLLALDVFVAQDVDVVILEVGIGGRLDATNVIETPVVCGITTLDLDHVRVLGDSLDQIAYAKAGIFKRNVPAYTTAQDPLAMATLRACAVDTQTPLFEAPVLHAIAGGPYTLGLQGDYQRINAGLAAALATAWLQHRRGERFTVLDGAMPLEASVREGLRLAFWPARSHVMEDLDHDTRFYIDGAHTLKSLEVCAEWFTQAKRSTTSTTKTALVFTIHFERNVARLIAPLLTVPFDRVYFCATSAGRPSLAKMNTFSEALEAAGLGQILSHYSAEELARLDDVPTGKLQWQTTLARLWTALQSYGVGGGEGVYDKDVRVLPSVVDCIHDLRKHASPQQQWSVLATGSLYLAGETLEFLGWKE